VDKKLNHVIRTNTYKANIKCLNVTKKWTSNKMVFVKFIYNVWESVIVPTLSKMHGTGWPGFDGK